MNASAFGKRGRQFAKVVGVAVVIAAIGALASSLHNNFSIQPSSNNNQNVADVSNVVSAAASTIAPAELTAAIQTTSSSAACKLNLQFNTTYGSATKGGTMEYLLVAKNIGAVSCTNVKLSLYYAANEHFVSSSPKPTSAGYYWVLNDLVPGAKTNVTLATMRSAPLTSTESPNEACLAAANSANVCVHAKPLSSGSITLRNTSSQTSKPTTTPTTQSNSTVVAEPPPVYTPQIGSSGGGAVSLVTQAPTIAASVSATPAPAPTPAPTPAPVAVTDPTPPSVVATADAATPPPQSSPSQPSSNGKDYGVWVWTSAYNMSQSAAQQIVSEAAANNFNVLYMTVDSSLNLSGAQLTNYEASLNTLLTLAAAQNISVEAEAGASDWSQKANWSNPQAIMDFVANYNQSHSIKFRGVQFDIEPYTTPAYTSDQVGTLTDYVSMAETLVGKAKTDGLQLGLVIPAFYDGGAGATPKITVDGISDYTYNHLVRLLGELPNGRIYVMSYRNFASGPNGTIDISQAEVSLADSSNVKVIVGQETGNVQPSTVSFFGMTKAQMAAQIAIVNQTFAGDTSFDGIAVDYLDPYLQLQ